MIENHAYVDRFGRETVTFNRTFELPQRRRRFVATMVHSERRGGVVDYLGTHFDGVAGSHRIEVVVSNDRLGRLFGYRGWFTAQTRDVSATGVPWSVKPVREERRD